MTRLDEDRFWIVTAPATRVRDRHHLERALVGNEATLTDETEAWATLGLMGPRSRVVLEDASERSLPNDVAPFGSVVDLEVAGVPVRALRVTYVGELGWELYMRPDRARLVFDRLVELGAAEGLRPCGFRAMLSCRIEKGYRHWSHDVTPDDDPLAAGLGFAVAWDKSADFVGRAALEALREAPRSRRLLHFAIDDTDAMIHHDEPIFRNGERMGLLTSGAWGHRVEAAVGLGWATRVEGAEPLPIDAAWVREGDWEIEVAGRRFSARASLRAFYDPKSERVRR